MKTRKLFTFLVVVAILFGGFVFKPAPAKAIKNFTVELTTNTTGTDTRYKFNFTIEKKVDIGDFIYVVFPAGTRYEIIPTKPPTSDPCSTCFKADVISLEDGSVLFKYNSRIVLDPEREGYQNIHISLPLTKKTQDSKGNWMYYKFYNPTLPGNYTYKLSTQAEPAFVESQPVEIRIGHLSNLKAVVAPQKVGEIADYQFSFTIGKKLRVHQWIKLIFPKGTTFIPPIPDEKKEKIERLLVIGESINFCQLADNQIDNACIGLPIVSKNSDGTVSILFNTWLDLDPDKKDYRDICIRISSKAGIVNPLLAGTYTYKLSTQAEPAFIESEPLEIISP